MIDKVSSQGVYPTSRIEPASNEGRRPSSNQQKQTTNREEQPFTKDKKQVNMKDIVEGLNKFLQPSSSSLKFEFHEDLNEYYVTVVDETTKEVIKEIPPKRLLDMYAAMTEYLGIMVDKKI